MGHHLQSGISRKLYHRFPCTVKIQMPKKTTLKNWVMTTRFERNVFFRWLLSLLEFDPSVLKHTVWLIFVTCVLSFSHPSTVRPCIEKKTGKLPIRMNSNLSMQQVKGRNWDGFLNYFCWQKIRVNTLKPMHLSTLLHFKWGKFFTQWLYK